MSAGPSNLRGESPKEGKRCCPARDAGNHPLAAAAAIRRSRHSDATASQPSTAVTFTVPAGACDCHTHIFGDPQRFPFASGRTYTPEAASVAEMRALHRALRTTRVVIVQPSVYGLTTAARSTRSVSWLPMPAALRSSTTRRRCGARRHASRRDPRNSDQSGHSRSNRP